MKIITVIFLFFLVGGVAFLFAWNQEGSLAPTSQSVQLSIGDLAPKFALKDQDGKVRKLSEYSGKRVVVYFFLKQIRLDEQKKLAGSATFMENIKKKKL